MRLNDIIGTKQDPSFKKWFSGSKVVDQNGNPLVCFHGTIEDFTEFKLDSEWRTARGLNRLGFWFDVQPQTPNYFADGKGGNIKPCYLSIKKPFVFNSEPIHIHDQKHLDTLSAENKWREFNTHVSKMDRSDSFEHMLSVISAGVEYERGFQEWEDRVVEWKKEIEAEGYDGIRLPNTLADAGTRFGKETDWWIAFKPNQIKSIYAKKFDPNSNRIDEGKSIKLENGRRVIESPTRSDILQIIKSTPMLRGFVQKENDYLNAYIWSGRVMSHSNAYNEMFKLKGRQEFVAWFKLGIEPETIREDKYWRDVPIYDCNGYYAAISFMGNAIDTAKNELSKMPIFGNLKGRIIQP